MKKQDRQGVRTPADVERKYNLGRLAAAQGSPGKQNDLQQLSQTLAQFMAATNSKFQELEGHIQTFFYSGVPTLENAPAVDWKTADSKAEHVGDLYCNTDDGSLYLFNGDGTDYEWVKCSGSEDSEDTVLKSELLTEKESDVSDDDVYNAKAINGILLELSETVVAKKDIATKISDNLSKDKIYNAQAINEALAELKERLQTLEKGSDQLLDYSVTFIVDGETYEIISVKKGNSVDAPLVEPTSEEGNFAGWYIDEERVSFPYTPTTNTEILAKFSSLITMLYEHYSISETEYPYIFIFYNGNFIYPYFANTCTVSSGSISLSGVKDSAISKKLTDVSDTSELVNAILEHTPSLSSADYNNTYKTNFTYYANFDLSSFGTYYPL